jgi:hypothetical protein
MCIFVALMSVVALCRKCFTCCSAVEAALQFTAAESLLLQLMALTCCVTFHVAQWLCDGVAILA